MATPRTHNPAHDPTAPTGPTRSFRRRGLALLGAVAVAVPLALTAAGSSQAAPTLTIAEAQAQLTALQQREDQATEAYNQGTIAANAAATKAAAAQAQVATQNKKLLALQQGIASFAVATYTNAGGDPIETLLAGGDPNQIVAQAATLDQIAAVHGDQLRAIQAQRVALVGATKVANDQAAAAKAAQTKLAGDKAAIDKIVAQEQAVLDHLQAQQRAELLAQQAAQQAAAAAQARSASYTSSAGGPTSAGPVPASSGAAHSALAAAYSQMGKPYRYGGAGPDAYDCSGLTMWAFAHAGVSLPHSAAGQMGYGTPVSRDQLQPGDLVFFDGGGHVGIYVGNGNMIDANHTGGWVGVRPLYSGYDGARRL